MTLNHIVPALLDTVLALAAMGFCSHIVWDYIDQKTRAEHAMTGDDASFLAALAIVAIFVLTLVVFGVIGWLAG